MSDESNKSDPSLTPEQLREKVTELRNRNNKKDEVLITTLAKVLESSESLMGMARSEEKQRRFRLFLWFMPVLLLICWTVYDQQQKSNYNPDGGYVAQVQMRGEIALGGSISADNTIPSLRKAFADKKAKGVVIRISSPGGSPAQSILIHDEIMRLKKDYDRPVTLIGEEQIASGGFWISLAADNIHVLPSTIVGSIGVIFDYMDISKLAEKFEIEKHIITAGKNKHRIDLFKSPRKEDIEKLQKLADQLHGEFIALVKDRRGNKLKGDPEELFSGDFWLGHEAVELGLVDNVTSTSNLLLETYQTENVLDYSRKPGLLEQLNPMKSQIQGLLKLQAMIPTPLLKLVY